MKRQRTSAKVSPTSAASALEEKSQQEETATEAVAANDVSKEKAILLQGIFLFKAERVTHASQFRSVRNIVSSMICTAARAYLSFTGCWIIASFRWYKLVWLIGFALQASAGAVMRLDGGTRLYARMSNLLR